MNFKLLINKIYPLSNTTLYHVTVKDFIVIVIFINSIWITCFLAYYFIYNTTTRSYSTNELTDPNCDYNVLRNFRDVFIITDKIDHKFGVFTNDDVMLLTIESNILGYDACKNIKTNGVFKVNGSVSYEPDTININNPPVAYTINIRKEMYGDINGMNTRMTIQYFYADTVKAICYQISYPYIQLKTSLYDLLSPTDYYTNSTYITSYLNLLYCDTLYKTTGPYHCIETIQYSIFSLISQIFSVLQISFAISTTLILIDKSKDGLSNQELSTFNLK
jgi:hypothetical protein